MGGILGGAGSAVKREWRRGPIQPFQGRSRGSHRGTAAQ